MRSASSTNSVVLTVSETPETLRIALLHGDDFLDVLDILPEQFHFFELRGPFVFEMFGQFAKVAGQVLSLGIGGNKSAEIGGVFVHQCDNLGKVGDSGLLQIVGHEGGGDIDAVEHVADVVEHAGGHLSHARLARSDEKFLVRFVHLRLHPFALVDFLVQLPGSAAAPAGAASQPSRATLNSTVPQILPRPTTCVVRSTSQAVSGS